MYCFIDWVETEEQGISPDLPEDVFCDLLAEPGGDDDENKHAQIFGLWEIRINIRDRAAYPQCEPVSLELHRLIESAKGYPPAIALASVDMDYLTGSAVSRSDFARIYAERLRFYLKQQKDNPYLLAEALVTDGDADFAYKRLGDFCWIIGYHPDLGVDWVYDRTIILRDPPSHFDIAVAALAARFPVDTDSACNQEELNRASDESPWFARQGIGSADFPIGGRRRSA